MGAMERTGEMPRDDDGDNGVTCVWCDSRDVERIGEFGPGLMTEQWYCLACKSPFELVKKRGDLS